MKTIDIIKKELEQDLKIKYEDFEKLDSEEQSRIVRKNNFSFPFKGSSYADDHEVIIDCYPEKKIKNQPLFPPKVKRFIKKVTK